MINDARPPLTPVEKDAINGLAETLKRTDSQFCCGGTIRLPSSRKLCLFYRAGPEGQAQCVDFSQTIPEGISKLLDACVPSAHGRGNETVYDESYRLARELCQDTFALSMDILNGSGVLNDIAALTSPRNSGSELEVQLYKLNTYDRNGFFKPHRDTPKSDRHLGTIVVALPIAFEGGALRISHGNRDIFFDWGTTATESHLGQGTALPWAFLFSDVEHEVLPVTSGTRVTLAYDVFASEPSSTSHSFAMEGTKLPLFPDIDAILKNKDFLPGGGKLAIAMSHAYPMYSGLGDTKYITTGFAGHLKGLDAILYRALTSAGITVNIRAVYNPHVYMEDLTYDQKDDGFGPIAFDEAKMSFYPVLHTSEQFRFQDYGDRGVECWQDPENMLVETFYGAKVEHDLIWVVRPSIGSYSKMGNYITYGNAPSLEAVYAAAAFVLDIPAIGNGSRATK